MSYSLLLLLTSTKKGNDDLTGIIIQSDIIFPVPTPKAKDLQQKQVIKLNRNMSYY